MADLLLMGAGEQDGQEGEIVVQDAAGRRGRRYGPAACCILNYDFTFLAILLSGPHEEEVRHGRCTVHPVHGRDYLPPSPALDLAADESVILAYWQARD